jgi:hypothetical protein
MQSASRLAALLPWGLMALLALLPFEARAGVQLPGLLLTNVELLALAALGLWAAVLVRERRLPRAPRPFALALGGVAVALLLSALLAPEHRADAAKFALRQAQGALLALCVAEAALAAGARAAPPLLAALLAGASASAALGLWEISESPLALAALAPFKTQLSLMESLIRLSATFAYANIAAMFFEALLPVALCGGLGLFGARWRLPCVAAAALLATATILSFSRAALLGMGAALALVPLAVWAGGRPKPRADTTARFAGGRGLAAQAAALSLGVGLLALVALMASPSLRLRLAAPDPAEWYGARYESQPVAPMEAGEVRRVPVRVTNTGRAAWPERGARPVMLASHWLSPSGAMVSFEGLRTPLPRALAPGESAELMAQVQAPIEPGSYVLAWDLLRENGGGWFSQGSTPMGRVPVLVTPATGAAPTRPAPEQVILPQPPSPSRTVLWGVALRLWAARPLLGIGPDVFRHVYGRELGLERFDERIHTNSLYLEVLTGAGLLGALAFAALLAPLLWRAARALLAPPAPSARHSALGTHWWCLLAATLALLAFLVHGALDVFLAFTPTYLLFWVCVGLVAGLAQHGALREHLRER